MRDNITAKFAYISIFYTIAFTFSGIDTLSLTRQKFWHKCFFFPFISLFILAIQTMPFWKSHLIISFAKRPPVCTGLIQFQQAELMISKNDITWFNWFFLCRFLAATKQLYKWYFPSVRLSVCPSVCLSVCLSVCHTFLTMFPSSYHHEIFRSYYQWLK